MPDKKTMFQITIGTLDASITFTAREDTQYVPCQALTSEVLAASAIRAAVSAAKDEIGDVVYALARVLQYMTLDYNHKFLPQAQRLQEVASEYCERVNTYYSKTRTEQSHG